MPKWLKIGGGVVAGLALLGVVAGGVGFVMMGSMAQARLDKTWPEVKGKDLPIPYPLTEAELEELRAAKRAELEAANAAAAAAGGTPAPAPVEGAAAAPEPDLLAGVDLNALAMERAVARGTALVNGRLPCTECHGKDGAGTLVVDAQPVWTWYAPNITKGGRTKDYTPADWDRIVRHGVKKDGSTATMPSIDFMRLSDQEVSDLAAYFLSQPANETPQPDIVLGPVGKILLATGTMPLSAELIDHSAAHPELPPPAVVGEEFGKHVAATCAGCHRPELNGGPIKQGPPDWPPAGNLTEAVPTYTEEEFLRVFSEGKRKDGTPLREPMSMVTKMQLTDVEMKAMYAYLHGLKPVPTGE